MDLLNADHHRRRRTVPRPGAPPPPAWYPPCALDDPLYRLPRPLIR
ncbi:hypothetical protein [Deinococcus apachensis]|nr:hypothetical protein [Deinococcus apachensis]